MKGNEINQTDYHSLPVATRIRTPNNIISNFTIAHNLLVDRFLIEITQDKKKNRTIELTLGDKVCFVKTSLDLICDTIARGHLSKNFSSLESATLYILVTDNKLDFYKIVKKPTKGTDEIIFDFSSIILVLLAYYSYIIKYYKYLDFKFYIK